MYSSQRPHTTVLQVLTLPPGAVVLASSPTAPFELWCWGTNVLASQFHIEFDESLVLDKIWTSLTDVGRLNAQQSEDSRRVLAAGGQHSVQMLQVRAGAAGALPLQEGFMAAVCV